MSSPGSCPNCLDHRNSIRRNEESIKAVWKEINTMKWWVISGMMAVIINLGLAVFNVLAN